MKNWLRYLGVILSILLIASLANLFQSTLQESLHNYETSYSLSSEVVTAREKVSSPFTKRVVLVVLDGISMHKIKDLPFFGALIQEGAVRTTEVYQPSVPRSAYAVISSGARPEINGIIQLNREKTLPVDHLFLRVKEAGFNTDAVASQAWFELNGNYFSKASYFYSETLNNDLLNQRIFRKALNFIKNSSSQLLLINFLHAGNNLREVDEYIQGLAAELDFQKETLLIIPGQAGESLETRSAPLIALGRGISPGTYTNCQLADIAPTITGLLGLAPPTEAQGRILWDMLAVPAQPRSLIEQARGKVLLEFAATYLGRLGYSELTRENLSEAALLLDESGRYHRTAMYESAFQKGKQANELMAETLGQVREDKIWRGRWLRLPIALFLFGLILLGSTFLSLRQRIIVFVAGLVYLLIQHLVGSVYLPVLSVLILVGIIRWWFNSCWALHQESERLWPILWDYLSGIAGVYLVLSIIMIYGFILHGPNVSWYLPDLGQLSVTLRTTKELVLLSPLPILAPLLAWIDLAIRQKTRPQKKELTLNGTPKQD